MVFSTALLAGITLATATSAVPLLGSKPTTSPTSFGTCQQQMMPISVDVEYTKINLAKPSNQGKLTGFLANWWATGSTVGQKAMPPNADGSRPRLSKKTTYNVFTQMCYPNGWKDGGAVILGTHGINFDHSYWEFGYSKEYNFIEAANKAGYAVFTHDRLGVGQSDKPDGKDEVQAWTEVEIMHGLTQYLRKTRKFSKVVGIGHSFGSVQLTGLAQKYPDDHDAMILTGYTPSLTTVPLSFTGWAITLAKDQPDANTRSRWMSLPGGAQKYQNDLAYWGTGSESADRFAFFAEGYYDEGAFKHAYDRKQTFTMGEFMTIGEPISQPAPNYKGHVFVVTGEKDLIFCGGNCNQKPTKVEGNNLLDDTKTYFPNCKSFHSYVPAGAGHALFTHHGTDKVFANIMGWMKTATGM